MATHALLISLAVTAVAVGVAAGAAAAPVAVDIDWGSTLMQTETGAPPLSLQPRGRNLGPLLARDFKRVGRQSEHVI